MLSGPFPVPRHTHRVYWFDLVTTGHTAHGSMPFLGVNAIDHMTTVLEAVRTRLAPRLALRTTASAGLWRTTQR